jgi:hypothetical protein
MFSSYYEQIAHDHQQSLVAWAENERLARSAKPRLRHRLPRVTRRARVDLTVPAPCAAC